MPKKAEVFRFKFPKRMPAREGRAHCPHHTRKLFTSHPPRQEVECCWCKTRGIEQPTLREQDGHGPHAPMIVDHITVKWDGDVDSCPKAP